MAGSHLRKAGLAEYTAQATLRITTVRIELRKNPPPRIVGLPHAV